MGDVAEVAGIAIGHGVMFEKSPDAFDGVHIRRVSGQVVDHDLAVLGFDMRAYELRAMRLQTIPDDQQLLADNGLQGFEELDDLRTLDRAIEQPEVAQAGDHRELLPAEAVLEDGRLTLRSPGS
jgi:hypothetical protein